ncbi:putative non-specific serine/threonine protein kinase [Helianthus annuus]|nr:putative non-specific serine/threonine protein kinase [Helianthus annuus]
MVAHPLLFLMEMLAIILILYSSFVFAKLDTQEGEVLKEILEKLGMGEWSFGKDPCSRVNPKFDNVYVECLCPFKNNTTCHIINMNIKNQNLSSGLPLEFTKLRYLRILDLSRNYLSGSVPSEWANMRLSNLSLMGNRLSGPFPKTLTRMTTLVDLSIEGNRFSGPIPGEIANLKNLTKLVISSNDFTGQLPVTLANLTNLTDMRINDNNFTGKIPNFIGQWTKIEKLYIQGCSLEGPFPYSSISALTQLVDLRISDLKGGAYSKFPQLEKMTNLKKLLLRNCLIHGTIPEYIGNMKLEALDLSFNNFSGRIPQSFSQLRNAKYIYLTQNNLSGTIPEWVFTSTKDVDVSYNQFIWDASHPHMCAQGFVNMVQSHSSAINDGTNILPCLRKDFPCNKSNDQLAYSMFINCGGEEVYINNTLKYKEDLESKLTPYYDGGNWAFSSTGNFLDDSGDDVYIISNTSNLHNISTSDTKLFINARTAAISLTYYGLCLLNGNYNLTLYFAEIVFSQDKSYNSLGKRVFDVYVQGELKIKDFDIVKEAGGTGRAVLKKYTVNVQKNTLKIQLYWAGKGTTCIPKRGSYGPIISAISVEPSKKFFVYHTPVSYL